MPPFAEKVSALMGEVPCVVRTWTGCVGRVGVVAMVFFQERNTWNLLPPGKLSAVCRSHEVPADGIYIVTEKGDTRKGKQ